MGYFLGGGIHQKTDTLEFTRIRADEPEKRSLELSPNITVELNDKNELIGVEILHASAFLRDAVLESVQARTLQLIEAQAQ